MKKLFPSSEKKDMVYLSVMIVSLILVLSSCLLICSKKQVWFCDEPMTYESANSTWKANPMEETGVWLSGSDMDAYFAATDLNPHFFTIERNLWSDHVPFYFWLFRIVSMLCFPAGSSMWIGMGINIALLAIFTFWAFGRCRYHASERVSPIAGGALFVIVYIVTGPYILDLVNMIRMYLLLVLEFIVFTYCIGRVFLCSDDDFETEWVKGKRLRVTYFIMVFAGILTHYLFWPYFGMMSALVWIALILMKKIKRAMEILKLSLIALFCTVIADPYWIYRMFKYNFGKVAGNSAAAGAWGKGIVKAFEKLIRSPFFDLMDFRIVLVITLLVFAMAAFAMIKNGHRKLLIFLGLFVAADYIFALMVQVTYNTGGNRYFYPAFAIWDCMICLLIVYSAVSFFRMDKKILLAAAVLSYAGLITVNAFVIKDGRFEYLTTERAVSDDSLKEQFADVPWVVYYDTVSWKLYCSAFEFKIPEKLCFISSAELPKDPVIRNDTSNRFLLVCTEEEKDDALRYIEAETGVSRRVAQEVDMVYLKGYLLIGE